MNNLIKEAQARHDADETWYAYWDDAGPSGYPRPAQHKGRGDLLAVIDAARALADKWREEDEIMSHGGRLLTALDCVEDIEALLNGESK